MNPLLLVTLLAVGAAANGYGYNEPAINVRVEEPTRSYSAPQSYSPPPQVRTESYSQPQRQESSYGSYSSMPARHIPITRFNHEIRGSESQSVDWEGNGIKTTFHTNVVRGRPSTYEENGVMKQTDSSLEQSGHSYHEIEGQHIALTWSADDNGFRATGDHLPKPVEMPAEHAEAHRLALSRSSSSGYDSGSYSSSPSYGQQQVRSGY